jgi:transposase
MTIIRLSGRASQKLEQIARSGSGGREVRRAQALLWLHQGESVTAVAQRLGLSRRAIYKMVQRYQSRLEEPVELRVGDRPHPGRPPTKRDQAQAVIAEWLTQPPQRYGYRALVWTTPMLRHQVEQRLPQPISQWTIRRALRLLNYRYKRPRYVLARRSPTWHQAKGGSNAA